MCNKTKSQTHFAEPQIGPLMICNGSFVSHSHILRPKMFSKTQWHRVLTLFAITIAAFPLPLVVCQCTVTNGGTVYNCSNLTPKLSIVPILPSTVEELYLSDNVIEAIPDVGFGSLVNLRILDLAGNILRFLPSNSFTGCEQLQRIDIRRNPSLTDLPFDILDSQLNLRQFNFDSTSIADCRYVAPSSEPSVLPTLRGSCGRDYGDECAVNNNCPVTGTTTIAVDNFFTEYGTGITSRTCRTSICCNTAASQTSETECPRCDPVDGSCYIEPLPPSSINTGIMMLVDWSGSYTDAQVTTSMSNSVSTAHSLLTTGGYAVGMMTYDFKVYNQFGFPYTIDPVDVRNVNISDRSLTASDLPRAFDSVADAVLSSNMNLLQHKILYVTSDQLDVASCINLQDGIANDCLFGPDSGRTRLENNGWLILFSWESDELNENEFDLLKLMSNPEDSRMYDTGTRQPSDPNPGATVSLFFPVLNGGSQTGVDFDDLFEALRQAGVSPPTFEPTGLPTLSFPTESPTVTPTRIPTASPTLPPSMIPSSSPSVSPTMTPSISQPTKSPTTTPTALPSVIPTTSPTIFPTLSPSISTSSPTSASPTSSPTSTPSFFVLPLASDSPGATASGTTAVIIIGIILLLLVLYFIYVRFAKQKFKPGDRVKVQGKAFAAGSVPPGTRDPAVGTVMNVSKAVTDVKLDEPWGLELDVVQIKNVDHLTLLKKTNPMSARTNQIAPMPTLSQSTFNPISFTPTRSVGGRTPQGEGVIEEKLYDNGARAYLYSNGTIKEEHPNGCCVYRYENGDKQQVFSDGRTVYEYESEGLVVSTWPSGELVREFISGPAMGQKETKYANGDKMIEFPDGTVKHIDGATGEEETEFGNGAKLVITTGGSTITTHPDGVIETVTPSGGQMTDYPSASSLPGTVSNDHV